MSKESIAFSYNWNNKLDCKAFTTLRLSDRFQVGMEISIILKGEVRPGNYQVIDKKALTLEKINQFVAYIDTGYSPEECRKILRRMYPEAKWETQPIYLYLIAKTK